MNAWMGVAMGLTAAASWATGSLVLRPILDSRTPRSGYELPRPEAVNFFKNLLAFAAFGVVWAIVGGSVQSEQAWLGLLVSGAIGFALGDTLFFAAIPLCGVQTTAVVSQLNVPLSVLMCWVWLDEALSLHQLGAIAVTLLGVCLVLMSGDDGRNRDRSHSPSEEERQLWRQGTVRAFGCAVLFSTSIVLGHGSFAQADVVAGSMARLIGGLIGGLLMAACSQAFRRARSSEETGRAGADLVSLLAPLRNRRLLLVLLPGCIFASVLALLPFGYSLKALEGGMASVLGSTTPIFAMLLSVAMGQRPKGLAIIGTLIVFAGVAGLGLTAAAG
ncbi:MAG: drug/metabolite transporter (DMT)-like permease [Planctomycetota bacterium]|jgi:drug/metabolite transporter (DMT)-like permease